MNGQPNPLHHERSVEFFLVRNVRQALTGCGFELTGSEACRSFLEMLEEHARNIARQYDKDIAVQLSSSEQTKSQQDLVSWVFGEVVSVQVRAYSVFWERVVQIESLDLTAARVACDLGIRHSHLYYEIYQTAHSDWLNAHLDAPKSRKHQQKRRKHRWLPWLTVIDHDNGGAN